MLKKNMFRVSIFFNLVIIVLGVVVFFKQGGWVYFANGPSKVSADQPDVDPIVEIKQDNFELGDKQSKEVVFAGDSQTDYFEWSEYFSEVSVANRGISGDTSEGLLKRINQVTKLNPKKVFLLIGINDIQQDIPVETIVKNYINIIKSIKEAKTETQVYVQSVFPVAGDLYENNQYKRSESINEAVAELNKRLAQLEGVTFINIADQFGNELAEEYTVDGLHLSKEGYEVWLSEIEEYVRK
ncbi:GDSL-type esterase/lipase family protein [Desemzia sp. FAM 23991]|uniref:GDSL-type esterase/lipase family protein n=1 Tax=unclassified Desemzia TaxID=2685243 RepID=UPI0038896F45